MESKTDVPYEGLHVQCPGRACVSKIGLFPSTVVEKHQRVDGRGIRGKGYQFYPLNVGFTSQMLPQVHVHASVDEAEGAGIGPAHPHERHHVHSSVVEEVVCTNFIIISLDGSRQLWT